MSKPYEIVVLGDINCEKDAARSLLHSVLNHVADVQILMLEAISKKFGHSVEDLVECLRDSSSVLEVMKSCGGVQEFVETKMEMKTKSGKRVVVKKEKKTT